jgi:hypothetical protein
MLFDDIFDDTVVTSGVVKVWTWRQAASDDENGVNDVHGFN